MNNQIAWDILFFRKIIYFICYCPLADDKYSVTSELEFSDGIDSSNFDHEKQSCEETILDLLKINASFVEKSDVALTFKRDLHIPTTTRIQKSTGSILVMTIGPFDKKNAIRIIEIADSTFFFDKFQEKNMNTPLVLRSITKTSKQKLCIYIVKVSKSIYNFWFKIALILSRIIKILDFF